MTKKMPTTVRSDAESIDNEAKLSGQKTKQEFHEMQDCGPPHLWLDQQREVDGIKPTVNLQHDTESRGSSHQRGASRVHSSRSSNISTAVFSSGLRCSFSHRDVSNARRYIGLHRSICNSRCRCNGPRGVAISAHHFSGQLRGHSAASAWKTLASRSLTSMLTRTRSESSPWSWYATMGSDSGGLSTSDMSPRVYTATRILSGLSTSEVSGSLPLWVLSVS